MRVYFLVIRYDAEIVRLLFKKHGCYRQVGHALKMSLLGIAIWLRVVIAAVK